MRKILFIVKILILSLVLIACDKEIETINYTISFYDNYQLINEIVYEKGDVVKLEDINNPSNKTVDKLINMVTLEEYNIETQINNNLALNVIWEVEPNRFIVNFYDGETFINEVSYVENSLIKLSDINISNVSEIDYLVYKGTNIKYELTTPVNKNLNLSIIWQVEPPTMYEVSFYSIDDLSLINTVLIENNQRILRSDINVSSEYVLKYYLDFNTRERYEVDFLVNEDLELVPVFEFIEDGNYKYDIFYLNDTHGAVLKNGVELGLASIANYIKNVRDENSIFITGGDIFQGQLISNDNRGSVIVEIFNHLELDAFVIGNHEFDWGLEEIMKYFNDTPNAVKANFPILGANVKLKSNDQRPDFIDTHVIINRGGIRIGIIGVIGDGQESSIAYPRVKDYYFSDAYSAVLQTANEINDLVDIILVVNHDDNPAFNEQVAQINKVSAVFNGHLHAAKTGYVVDRINSYNIPYIQSKRNGERVGHVTLNFERVNGVLNFLNGTASNISSHPHLNNEDIITREIINGYYQNLSHLYEEIVLISASSYSQNDLAYYIAKVMAKVSGSVLGVQNSGGTRSTFSGGQNITAADIFQVFPFDNLIIKADIKGSVLKSFHDNNSFTFLDIDYSSIKNNDYYTISTNDYVFYSSYNQSRYFSNAINVEIVGDMYATLYETMQLLKQSGKTHFNTYDEIDFWS